MNTPPAAEIRRGSARVSVLGFTRTRRPPSAASLARRRFMVNWAKRLLPLLGLALLGSIGLWPDFEGSGVGQRVSFRIDGRTPVGGARMLDAHYSSIDQRGEPYTVTATSAIQVGPDKTDLTNPKADITLQSGSWLMIESPRGVYRQKTRELDLSGGVTLYRDDGTTLRTESAAVDLANNAAASGVPVSAEGPFGTLDASTFSLLDGGAVIQFSGPARLVLNGREP